jgi:hypothetical protein
MYVSKYQALLLMKISEQFRIIKFKNKLHRPCFNYHNTMKINKAALEVYYNAYLTHCQTDVGGRI